LDINGACGCGRVLERQRCRVLNGRQSRDGARSRHGYGLDWKHFAESEEVGQSLGRDLSRAYQNAADDQNRNREVEEELSRSQIVLQIYQAVGCTVLDVRVSGPDSRIVSWITTIESWILSGAGALNCRMAACRQALGAGNVSELPAIAAGGELHVTAGP